MSVCSCSSFLIPTIARSSDSENTQDDLAHSLAIVRLLALFPSLFRKLGSESLVLFVRVDEGKKDILMPVLQHIKLVMVHPTSSHVTYHSG